MDDAKQNADRIWLRYSTQYTAGGRMRTIEMSIPVPLGATQEERERLFDEAEAGMRQLSSHVEHLANQAAKQGATGAAPGGQNGRSSAGTPVRTGSGAAPASSGPRPAGVAAPQTTEQPGRTQVQGEEGAPVVPRNEALLRQPVGASMPVSAGGDVPNNLTIPQFMKIINENLGLDSKQAMQKLGVRSLSGLNLRKALEQLQMMMQAESGNSPLENGEKREGPVAGGRSTENAGRSTEGPIALRPVETLPGERSAESAGARARENSVVVEVPRSGGSNGIRAVGFDEEEGLEDELTDDELDELDFSQELTNQQRTRAREVIKRLQGYGGMTVGSQSRLQALRNVISGQITDQQLNQVMQGVWSIKAPNKLKVDQVEAIISWAKEDDFVSDVENIIKLFEEEG